MILGMPVAPSGLAMTRARLQALLSSALFAALAPACGGSVVSEFAEDSGTEDTGADTQIVKTDTATNPVDTSTKADTFTPVDSAPVDSGPCSPIPDNSSCNEKVTYPCGLPFVPASSPPSNEECKRLCAPIDFSFEPSFIYCNTAGSSTGSVIVYCASCAVGRKPADLIDGDELPCADEDPIGTALAEMARVEAASVHAFRRLEQSLAGLGAAPELRARARRAARDEIAHARSAARLAKKRGAKPRPVRLAPAAAPSTFELALENAVEGCVHETLGVAYLEHQRLHASDPELRAHAAAIYDDELDHAALSWDLVAFFDRHLDDTERAELRRAANRALDNVVDEIGKIDSRVRTTLGLPEPAVVSRVVGTLRETLFAA